MNVINDYFFIYKLCSSWMNLKFSFEIQYNDYYGQFSLIIVLNLELSVWIVWKSHLFIIDSYIKVNFFFPLKFDEILVNAFHFVLWMHTWLWWNSSHRFHTMYLEINAKCYQNFVKSKKIKLTFTYESTINKCLSGWDRVTPLMKKVRFLCMRSLALWVSQSY